MERNKEVIINKDWISEIENTFYLVDSGIMHHFIESVRSIILINIVIHDNNIIIIIIIIIIITIKFENFDPW